MVDWIYKAACVSVSISGAIIVTQAAFIPTGAPVVAFGGSLLLLGIGGALVRDKI